MGSNLEGREGKGGELNKTATLGGREDDFLHHDQASI